MARRRRQRIPQGTFSAEVHGLSHEGRGIAALDGKTTFISGALPQETVDFAYTSCRGRFDEGRVLAVHSNNPHRVTPRCQHFDLCGGCSLQHLDHAQQIQLKQNVLAEQLQHFAQVEPQSWLAPLSGPQWHYRHKARLGVRWVEKKGGLLIGFRERHYSQFITPITRCEVLHPAIGERIDALQSMISQLDCAQHIAQLEVAVGEDASAIIVRHLAALTASDTQALADFGHQHELRVYTQAKGPDSVQLLWPHEVSKFLHYSLPDFNCRFAFHPTDFTQVNFQLNQLMVKQALDLLDPQADETILDLFCGLGNFSLPIATRAAHVVGVEGSQAMVERAYHNAALNQLNNCEFHAADLTQTVDADWAQRPYAKLLIDPPRSGAEEIVAQIERWQPQRLVYVSCNPATLARDAGILVQQKGYQLEQAGIMDMFPHTTHVESIAVFTPRG